MTELIERIKVQILIGVEYNMNNEIKMYINAIIDNIISHHIRK